MVQCSCVYIGHVSHAVYCVTVDKLSNMLNWKTHCIRWKLEVNHRALSPGGAYINNNSLHRVNRVVSSHSFPFPWLYM